MKKIILLFIISSFVLVPASGLKAQAIETKEELLRSLLQQQIEILTQLVIHLQNQIQILSDQQQETEEEKEIEMSMEEQFEEYITKRENKIKEETEIQRIRGELDAREGLKYSIGEKEYRIGLSEEGSYGSYVGFFGNKSELEILKEIYDIVVKREKEVTNSRKEKECSATKIHPYFDQGFVFVWDGEKMECKRQLKSGYYLDCCGRGVQGSRPKNLDCSKIHCGGVGA